MIRVVLVGWADDDWRPYRQAQWMAEVRRSPEVTRLPRHHYDLDEDAFQRVLEAWEPEGAGTGLRAASDLLRRFGAVEITGP